MSDFNLHEEITKLMNENGITLHLGVETMMQLICGNLIMATLTQEQSISETKRSLAVLMMGTFDHMLEQQVGKNEKA